MIVCIKQAHDNEETEEDEATVYSAFPNSYLLRYVSEGTNVPNFEDTIRKNASGNIQPYLIMVAGQEENSIFVVADGLFLNIPDNADLITAFDLLYKSFYTFNVKYPKNLQNFYNFFDYYIFKMNVKAYSTVSSLHINIINMKLEDDNSI